MKIKQYIGSRVDDEPLVMVSYQKKNGIGARRELKPGPSLEVWNKSPSGFEWGYNGSGPAQLALAILLDYTQDAELATRLFQDFKRDWMATADKEGFTITAEQIEQWLPEEIRKERLYGTHHIGV